MQHAEQPLFSYPKYWAECYGTAPFLPMSKKEMDALGWDSCDIIIVTGDAYVDHPSFGMAVIGRMLESQGFRVGIIAQPDWTSKDAFQALGKPNLFFGVTAGNMDSMINRYTADRKLRHDDAYTPNNEGGKRPDRAVTVYTQRCKEAYKGIPVVIGGIEASLRRIAHYDYWSDKVRKSVLFDSKADLLVYGNAERPLADIAHRFAEGKSISDMQDIRGTAVLRNQPLEGWSGLDSTHLDGLRKIDPLPNPYQVEDVSTCSEKSAAEEAAAPETAQAITVMPFNAKADKRKPWEYTYIKLPAYERVAEDKYLYAHASRVMHQETNPGCARALFQQAGNRWVWVNPPAYPLSTDEMDRVFGMAYQRIPHPSYGKAKIPAYDMIKTSVNIMRGCFGGCSFCSITEHEGRIIQSRSEDSIVQEIEEIRDKVPGFTGVISDLGGPTANMYRLNCKSPKAEQTCRRFSCVYPDICHHMDTDHTPTINLYRRARDIKGIKKILIASGVRYDLAVEDPRYVKELAKYHVGGYLKIAPEHTEQGPLKQMMKPGMDTYYKFKELFDKYSKEAGKEQYLIPYFISAHPGTTDKDMVNLALWLKQNRFKLDQVQNFYPSPLANATTMYHTEVDPLHKVNHKVGKIPVAKKGRQRKFHRALLRYHAPENADLIREGLKNMGLSQLIGNGPNHLVAPATHTSRGGKASVDGGQKAQSGRNRPAPSQRGLTRFSSDQPLGARSHDEQPKRGTGKKKASGKQAQKGRHNGGNEANRPGGKGGQAKAGQAKAGQSKSGARPTPRNKAGQKGKSAPRPR
ncbi:YgiQ family radical SAM protein [Corallincola spongiicola]|uniref:YgiQ family radical SAM protein n=1 Tax=Corallincola spongiicola TaxID=2520508 RepID=A0ABY1WNE9_9GAMM|nr:YgiQ family radical SAM protein [Corallincola spongiicola]TAA44995.1 YgiQ family radical SAM protein [Corallincola spongiicola]